MKLLGLAAVNLGVAGRCLMGLACAAVLGAGPALAQPKRKPLPEDLLPQSELDDPIGVDSESRALGTVPGEQPAKPINAAPVIDTSFGPEPRPLNVHNGEVLSAARGTRELGHRIHVELEPGRATVAVEARLGTSMREPSELRYRLAVPAGAALAALQICNARGCRNGTPERARDGWSAYDAAVLARGPGRPLPVAHAATVQDARGGAIVVRAAPIALDSELTIKLRYVAEAALHGGVVRLSLPARGMDAQATSAELTLAAPQLLDARIDSHPAQNAAVAIDPWLEVSMSARVQSGGAVRAEVLDQPCGKERCARAVAWTGTASNPPAPRELVIALDVSPSTEGPARGRLLPALAALLASAPEGSRVRALAFAGRASVLIPEPMQASQVALEPFRQAVGAAMLGSATRFEAVWERAKPWLAQRTRGAPRPLIVLLGDGGLTAGAARAFERARAAGVEVAAVNTADRRAVAALRAGVERTGGIVLDVGAEAEAAARGRHPAPLAERLSALFAPTIVPRVSVQSGNARTELGPLRAGEQLDWVATAAKAVTLRAGGLVRRAGQGSARSAASWIAVDARDLVSPQNDWPATKPGKGCDRRGPARRLSGLSADPRPLALAHERACAALPKAAAPPLQEGRGMPADPLLDMLRRRILPLARGCFRRDRAGRAQYDRRAVFAFTLAEREIVAAAVEGKIAQELRACLLSAVDSLEVPRFSGVVKVRYPLVTESLAQPEQVRLEAGTAAELDRMFGTATQ